MKKYLLCFYILFFFIISNVSGLTSSEISKRNVCSNIELAIANSDKSLTSVKCFDDYQTAKAEMDKTDNDNLVILERKNNTTRVIDAKMALVYLGVNPVDENTYYYSDSSFKTNIAYMNHHNNYGATDGVFLELNYSNYGIKVKTNGVTGWIKDGNYVIVPLNFTGSYSYYQVTDKSLWHYYSKDIQTLYSQFGRELDDKPSFLPEGRYYSHDGIYFYKYASDMIKDYMNDTYENSVNYNNPYYNYYMYLPHRARSNYSADDIDAYLKNNRNLIGTIYGKKYVAGYSNMYQTGIFFKSSETLYGANAILMMALATNESSLGQSSIAINKNNLFGHTAYDSSAYDSATGYLNPYQSIIGHANNYINCSYANPNDYRYYGSNVGNKSSGMNIKYASDPLWGEKAANYYYLFDRDNGYLDYNYYQLGITNIDSINTRTEPNMISAIPYQLKYENIPVIILGEVEGDSYNGSTKWYKIASDPNLVSGRTRIQSCSFSNYYNWDSYVYVHSSFIDKINKSKNGEYNTNNFSNIEKNYTYKEYATNATYEPKVGLITKDTSVYDTATLSVLSGKTIKKGHLTTVFMEAKDEDGKVVAYMVTVDYSKNQKGWIKASDLSFSDKDILKVSLLNSGDYLNVFTSPGGSVLGSLYTDTYTVIVDKMTYNNDLWIKIHYGVDNTYAWLNTNISTSKGTLSYTLDKLNQVPSIIASNKTLYLYENFDPKEGVTAYDQEDGNLTSDIKITKNNVNTSKAGKYEVTYEVSDSKGEKVSKTITVTVSNYQEGNPLFMYESLEQVSDTKFLFKGFLGVKKMDNKNVIHELTFYNQETEETYTFTMDEYLDYPYEMSSLDDDKAYDYSGGWFMGEVDLSSTNIKQGDYTISIIAYNTDTGYMTSTYFTNIAYQEMPRRVETKTRGFSFDVDYSYAGSPILLTIRDNGLLSYDIPPSMDPMYNFFNELSLSGNTLKIKGTSHNAFVSYSKNDTVKRELIFENTKTFERYTYDISYIDNGDYQVVLPVDDKLDKTRAWFQKEINLTNLKAGNYAIYIKTTSNDKTYYGELIDIAYTDFSTINTDSYEFIRVDEKRLRLELIKND